MLRFSEIRSERGIHSRLDLLIGVVATFEIACHERLLYREEEFPVVELRAQFARWLRDDMPRDRDFEFESMESDEGGLVWLRRVPEGWRIGSIHQEFAALDAMSTDDVTKLVTRFIDDVDRWVRDELQLDPSALT